MFSSFLKAQDFTINQYDVQLTIQPNGRIDVREIIQVNFHEPRRGIIRAIPYKYWAGPDWDQKRAIRDQYGSVYTALIKNIKVKSHPFIHYTSGDKVEIRIGDPDIQVKGKVTYDIQFSIWGAINDFGEDIEIPFNIIGHEWYTKVDKANFTIQYPGNFVISAEDFLFYTGYYGDKEKNASFDLSQKGTIKGNIHKELKPGQGVSIALRLDKDLFSNTTIPLAEAADRYYVDSMYAHYTLQSDGSIEVKEYIEIECTEEQLHLTRLIPNTPFDKEKHQFLFITDVVIKNQNNDLLPFKASRNNGYDEWYIYSRSGFFKGRQKIFISYKVYGSFLVSDPANNIYQTVVPYSAMDGKVPVRTVKIIIDYSKELKQVSLSPALNLMKPSNRLFVESRSKDRILFKSNGTNLFGIDDYITLFAASKDLDLSKTPYEVYAKDYFIHELESFITISNKGELVVSTTLELDLINDHTGKQFRWNFPAQFKDLSRDSDTKWIDLPAYNVFSRYFREAPFLDVLDTNLYWTADFEKATILFHPGFTFQKRQRASFSSIYKSLIYRVNDSYFAYIPLVYNQDENILNCRILVDTQIFHPYLLPEISDDQGNKIEIIQVGIGSYRLVNYVRPGTNLHLKLAIKSESASEYLSIPWAIWYANNDYVIIAVLITLILIFVWILFGKDEHPTVTTQFYPPEGMTPAEMGWLDDDVIHKRDLISLIFYWGAKGCLRIEEIPYKDSKRKKDYQLIKLQALPSDSKSYEFIFFNKLFSNRNSVKVSDLKYTMYETLKKTQKEIELYGKQNEFYLPGTRGFGSCLVALSVLTAIGGMIFAFIGVIIEDLAIMIALIILSLGLYFIGKYMPKKGGLGIKKYAQVKGFKEFIEMAEIDKLKTLIGDNPAYFEQTLPYAIAFGLADDWAEKFETIHLSPPRYYNTSDGKFHTPMRFTRSITRSMSTMTSSMTAGSSSSGSGGGRSFGGGYSSGRGFSGGGGRSW